MPTSLSDFEIANFTLSITGEENTRKERVLDLHDETSDILVDC